MKTLSMIVLTIFLFVSSVFAGQSFKWLNSEYYDIIAIQDNCYAVELKGGARPYHFIDALKEIGEKEKIINITSIQTVAFYNASGGEGSKTKIIIVFTKYYNTMGK